MRCPLTNKPLACGSPGHGRSPARAGGGGAARGGAAPLLCGVSAVRRAIAEWAEAELRVIRAEHARARGGARAGRGAAAGSASDQPVSADPGRRAALGAAAGGLVSRGRHVLARARRGAARALGASLGAVFGS